MKKIKEIDRCYSSLRKQSVSGNIFRKDHKIKLKNAGMMTNFNLKSLWVKSSRSSRLVI